MTEHEEIEKLINVFNTKDTDFTIAEKHKKIIINTLEKQVPKKPILKSGESLVHINKGDKPHEFQINKWQDWVCPCCGWFVGQRYNIHRNGSKPHPHDQRKSDYCNECGQRIDWSDKYE